MRDIGMPDGIGGVGYDKGDIPALVDGADTTMWVPPDAEAEVDNVGTVVIRVGAGRGTVSL